MKMKMIKTICRGRLLEPLTHKIWDSEYIAIKMFAIVMTGAPAGASYRSIELFIYG